MSLVEVQVQAQTPFSIFHFQLFVSTFPFPKPKDCYNSPKCRDHALHLARGKYFFLYIKEHFQVTVQHLGKLLWGAIAFFNKMGELFLLGFG